MFQRFKKVGKYLFVSVLSILLLLFILPYLFPKTIEKHIKIWANQSIEGQLDFKSSKLSFFKYFPSLTLSLEDVILKGAQPFENDTLIAAADLSFGINLIQLIKGDININEIFLEDGRIEILVNEEGIPNYNIFKSTDTTSNSNDTLNTELRLENIVLNNISLNYHDQTIPFLFSAKKVNYKGSGDLSADEFELKSRVKVDSAVLVYDGDYYLNNQSLGARLNTRINTQSLQFEFKDNGFKLNDLPVRFNATMSFLADGYDFDFDFRTKRSTFKELLSAVPATMGEWLEKAKVKGETQVDFIMKGKYIPSQNLYPDIHISANIFKGSIQYKGAPLPIKDIDLRARIDLPQLNTDDLQINVDTLFAKLGEDQLKTKFNIIGIDKILTEGNLQANLNFDQWSKALGLTDFYLKGNYTADLNFKGLYAVGQDPKSIRKKEIILSIPTFNFKSSFTNGEVKFSGVNESIHGIYFNLNASNNDGQWKNTKLSLDDLKASALNSIVDGFIHLNNSEEEPVNASIKTNLALKEFQQFVPLDSTFIEGNFLIDIVSNGNIDLENNIFPVTKGLLQLKDGLIQTKYYPTPIQNIQVEVEALDDKGSLSDLKVHIKPISFELAGLPFFIKANFENFDDIKYDVVSKGKLDIGTLYKIFRVDGYNIDGQIDTDFFMRGVASDLMNGRLNNVESKGKMSVKDIYVTTDILPYPLHLYQGVFTFDKDKMRFNNFKAKYLSSDLTLNGYFLNMLNWFMMPNQTLQGAFDLKVPYIDVDEWMVFNDATVDTNEVSTGVVVLPGDMKLSFTASVDKIKFKDLVLNKFKGEVSLADSTLNLKETGFEIAGAKVLMDGMYKSLDYHSAQFEYKVKADSFDIQKGYQSIPIFRELAPAAKNAYGLIGLDYELAGKLNADMFPDLKTLKGGGVISVKDVKLMGFKLMNAVSKSMENDNLKDPNVKGINIKSSIENSLITIDPVKMKIAGFRPKFQGQMTMGGKLQMKGRIGLPPLGIFGIPFNISGTSDNPIVQFKRGPDNKPLTEKDDSDLDEEDLKLMDSTQNVQLTTKLK